MARVVSVGISKEKGIRKDAIVSGDLKGGTVNAGDEIGILENCRDG